MDETTNREMMLRLSVDTAQEPDEPTTPPETTSDEEAMHDSLFEASTTTREIDEPSRSSPRTLLISQGLEAQSPLFSNPFERATHGSHSKDTASTEKNHETPNISPRTTSTSISPKTRRLSQPTSSPTSTSPSLDITDNTELIRLKKELQELVFRQLDIGTTATKRRLAAEKEVLILKIGKLERAERRDRVGVIKAPYNKPMKELPEPIGRREKQDLLKQVRRLEEIRFSPPKEPKRRREGEDDNVVDGEERFYLGIKKKRKKTSSIDNDQTAIDDKETAKQIAKLEAEKERERQMRLSDKRSKRKIVSKKK